MGVLNIVEDDLEKKFILRIRISRDQTRNMFNHNIMYHSKSKLNVAISLQKSYAFVYLA